jgi:hypothetical protein
MQPQIHVASPCTADWERMTGDNRVRHCAQCNLNVYNFAEMTSREVADLVAASKGHRLCGRLYRRADGTLLTSDCPVGLRTRVHRISRRVGLVLFAATGLSLAAAQTPQPDRTSLVQIEKTETGIHLVVFDASGAVIPKAQVVVVNHAGDQIAEGVTSPYGQIQLQGLAPDTYILTIRSVGFRTFKKTVTVPAQQTVNVETTLQVGQAEGAMMGVVVVPGVETEPSLLGPQLIPEPAPPDVQAPLPGTPQLPQRQNPLRKFFRALGRLLSP